jgi:hypothetical protein
MAAAVDRDPRSVITRVKLRVGLLELGHLLVQLLALPGTFAAMDVHVGANGPFVSMAKSMFVSAKPSALPIGVELAAAGVTSGMAGKLGSV